MKNLNITDLTIDQGTDSTYIAKLFYLLALMKNLQLPRN